MTSYDVRGGMGGYPPIHDVIKKGTGSEVLPVHIIDRAHSFSSPNTVWIPKSVFGATGNSLPTVITPGVAVNSITTVVY